MHCTDYFTVDRTGTYIINVIHFAQALMIRTSPTYEEQLAEHRAAPGKNYTVWYEYQ